MKRWSKEDNELIRKLSASHTPSQIRKLTGWSKGKVAGKLWRLSHVGKHLSTKPPGQAQSHAYSETALTETFADFKARKARERQEAHSADQ